MEYDFLLFIKAQILMNGKHYEQMLSLDIDYIKTISFNSETKLNKGTEAEENNSNTSSSLVKIWYML